jgi:cysteine desulfurase
MIYLDNNATTIMPPQVVKTMVCWCNKGNASASYASALEARQMMDKFRKYICDLCKITLHNGRTGSHHVIFTSGATEANCSILQSVVFAYIQTRKTKPHIVMSAIEHKSLIDMAKSYTSRDIATATYVLPSVTGHILAEDIESALTLNTCIICVMHANNETGAVNNIDEIGKVAYKYKIPYHCDTVQTFGKFPLVPTYVDSFCISFHKFMGPPGIGALVVKDKLVHDMIPMLFGSQNGNLRGGTENLPGIGAAYAATRLTMDSRAAKNKHMLALKQEIIVSISKVLPSCTYSQYMSRKGTSSAKLEIVYLSEMVNYLPNTILLSVVKKKPPLICNVKIKKTLEEKGIVISVGSACNTSSERASHVLYAMNADDFIRKGALRITLGDTTTANDTKKFIYEFLQIVRIL